MTRAINNENTTVYTATLGCKVNQYDTQSLRVALAQAGCVSVDTPALADVIIVNTCTVTAEADRKGRQLLRKLQRQNPHARVVITGCSATGNAQALSGLPGNPLVITTPEREAWAEQIVRALPELDSSVPVERATNTCGNTHRTRAFLKVQDGCNQRCAYCRIPAVRGPSRGRDPDEIHAEFEALVSQGVREIVLCGICMGDYHYHDWTLGHLLESLVKTTGDYRVRLSSIELQDADDTIVALIANNTKICRHLHLPLQSGSDRVLVNMRRRYTSAQFLARCAVMGQRIPELSLTTDVLVGFPGETNEDLAQTADVIRKVAFGRVHLFPYSRRQGTPAADYAHQLTRQQKQNHEAWLLEVVTEVTANRACDLVGTRTKVLIETCDQAAQWEGWSESYHRVRVTSHGSTELRGALVSVQIVANEADRLVGILA